MTSLDRLNAIPTFYERYYLCRNLLKVCSNFNLTLQFDNSDQRFNESSLSHALRRLIRRYPAFACNFFRMNGSASTDPKYGGRNYRKRALPDVYFSDLVHFESLSQPFGEAQLITLNEIFFALNEEVPLWKLFVYRYEQHVYLSFVSDHVLFDGIAALNFHKELYHELRTRDCYLPPLIVIFSDHDENNCLMPPTSNKIDGIYDVSWWAVATSAATKQVVEPIKKSLPVLTFPAEVGRPQVQFDLFPVLPSIVARALSVLRPKNLTLTPYICAIADEAIRKCFLPYYSTEPLACSFEVAIDGRRYAPRNAHDLKFNYCVGVTYVKTKPQTPIVDSIQHFARQIRDQVENRDTMRNVGLMRHVNPWEYVRGKASASSKHEKMTVLVSNLGQTNVEDCKSMCFSQDLGCAAYWGILVVSSPKGGMSLVVTYAKHLKNIVNHVTGLPAADMVGPYLQERFEFLIEQLEEMSGVS